MRREADRLRFQKADQRVGLVDGATWIREQMQLHFAELDALGLDFYHLSENVHRARRKVFGEESPEGKAWADELMPYGETTFSGNTVTVTQDDAAVDVTLISPEKLTYEVMEKSFEETSVPKPFDAATSIKTIRLRPSKPESRTFFLSVMAPRAASAP